MQDTNTDTTKEARGALVPMPAQDGSAVYCQPHAFGDTTLHGVAPYGSTIREIVRSLGLPAVYEQYLEVYIDDVCIPATWWDKIKPKANTAVFVRVIPQGGGGNKTVRTVAAIAIAVAAVATGQYYAADAAAFFGTSNAVGAAIVTVGVQLVGNLALNALIPPQLPTSPDANLTTSAPRYQLTGTQNRLEPYANIPRVMGFRRMYPMHAAHPYSEVAGNDEYLRICLCVGWGPLDISEIKIGDTPITSYDGVEYEVREGWPDDQPLTLFTRTVSEQNVSALLVPDDSGPDVWITRTSETNVTEIMVDVAFPGGLTLFSDSGDRAAATVTFIVEYRPTNTGTWIRPDWLNASEAGFDTAGLIKVTAAEASAVRKSGRFAVSVSETQAVEVRMRRATADLGTRSIQASYWSVLRSVQRFNPIRQSGLALIALRIKASGQLNGVPSSINCVAKSYLPVWDGLAWSWQITNSPAWAFCDILRRRGGQTYLDDSRINLYDIQAWAIACSEFTNGGPRWSFNSVIEGGSVFSALRTIAAHARASFTIRNGRYTITRDVQQSVPVQHITPRNSFGYSGRKTFVDQPHALRIQFVNADLGYQEDERIVYSDGYNSSNATKFETVELPGCTSAAQAWREGRYMLAVGLLRPEEHVVSMDIEALRCTAGDLVRFSHDAIDIGLLSTRIKSWGLNDNGQVIAYALDDEYTMETGKSYAMRVRLADGTSVVYSLSPYTFQTTNVALLAVPIQQTGAPQVGDLVMLGEASRESAPMIVKKIECSTGLTAKLTLVDAQNGVYTADSGAIPPFNTYITIQTSPQQQKPSTPTVSDFRSDESALLRLADGTLQDRITFSIFPAPASIVSVDSYDVYWSSIAESSWNVTKVAAGSPVFLAPVVSGETYRIKVRGVTRFGVAGDFSPVQNHTVVGKTTPPSTPTNLSAFLEYDSVQLKWSPNPEIDVAEYEIRYGTDWSTATFVARARTTSAKVLVTAVGTLSWLVKAIDVTGLYSSNAASVTFAVTGPLAVRPTASFSGDQVVLKWDAPFSPLTIDYYEVRYGSSFLTATSVGTLKATTFSAKAVFSNSRTFWVVAVDVNGNVGPAGSVEAVITPAVAPTLRAQVIDNNVLLYWNEVQGSLPTETYEIRVGTSFASGTPKGTKSGGFTTVFETVAGTYKYWVAAKDTAGNYGAAGSVAASVSQPPDYVLQLDNNSTFSGTKSNMAESGDGAWLLPVNTTETYQQHFTSRSWTSPKDQVDAGYPLVIQPTLATGYYEETIDAGALLPATKVTLTTNGATLVGTTTLTPKLSLSADGTTWTDYDDTSEVFSSGFRYVKYRITVTASNATSLYRLVGINVRLDSKLKSDAGTGNAVSSHTGGTVVNFNVPFIDVAAIEVTPQATTPLIAVYDFVDAPNPTSFKVLLFTTGGARASGPFSWSAKGY